MTNSQIPVLGIGVRVDKPTQEGNVFKLAQRTAEHMGAADAVKREDVVANCDYVCWRRLWDSGTFNDRSDQHVLTF